MRKVTRIARRRASVCWLVGAVLICCAPDSARAQPSMQELEARVAGIFEESCARSGCHAGPAPQQGLNLRPNQFFDALVARPSRQRPDLMRVKPGRPDSSYLMMKVHGASGIVGAQMPFAGDRLSDEEKNTLEQWIAGLPEEGGSPTVQAAGTEEAFPFDGWKVINLPTTRALDAGSWLFLISHRFNPQISDGYDALFGLDGSGVIYMSMGYALTDRLLVALGRSNSADDVELQSRYRLAQQGGSGAWPVGISLQGAVNWISENPLDEDASRLRSEAFKITGQVSLTRELRDRIGLALVPGILVNPAEEEAGEGPLFTLGLGGRWRFYQNLSLVAEWVPILSGYTLTRTFGNEIRFDTGGLGFEVTTGGHVFQIVLSNSVGLTSDQYLRGGDLDLINGELRLGFNIFRILNF